MQTPLLLSLQIALLSMAVVFIAILLLWALIALLVRLTPENDPDPVHDLHIAERERKRRAAVAAVSAALEQARNSEPQVFPLPPTAVVSAWQAVMRSKMLNRKGPQR